MGRTVLCVDDDRALRKSLARALHTEGYRVLTAGDGEQALQRFEQEVPDLVLLDLRLPRRDGFRVLEQIRCRDGAPGRVPAILLSGVAATPEHERRAVALGAQDLLTKPVPLERLLRVVRRHLPEGGPADGPSGSLGRVPLPELLRHLHGQRASGVLHLQRGRKRKWIQLREGRLVAVRGNLVNECLGNLLVRMGRISSGQEVASRQRARDGELQGEMLVAMGAVGERDLALALRAQAEQKLFEAFSWPGGSFRFEPGASLQRANALHAEPTPARLILRGVRGRLPGEIVDAFFARHGGGHPAAAASPPFRLRDVDADPAAEQLLRGLDGTRPLGHFADVDLAARRTLYAFIATGLVELRSAPRAGAARPQPVPGAGVQAPAPAADPELGARLEALLEDFDGQNHFQVLGVAETAGDEEIRAAFERRAEVARPERAAGAGRSEQRLAARVLDTLQRAHAALADPRARQTYLLALRRAEREAAERAQGQQAIDAELHFQRGEEALQRRRYPQALLCFGKALELHPERGEYFSHYGWALHLCHPREEKMTREAIDHVRRGAKLARHGEKPYLFLGRLYKAVERPDLAEKMFERAVQLRPGCAEALSELRLIHLRRRKEGGFIRRLLRR